MYRRLEKLSPPSYQAVPVDLLELCKRVLMPRAELAEPVLVDILVIVTYEL